MTESNDNVIYLDMLTKIDIPADRVLEQALGKLEKIVVCGLHNDGSEYFASSIADGGTALWYLERCKKRLLEIADE